MRIVEMNPWSANKKVMAELQRERTARDGPPEPLHQEKPQAGRNIWSRMRRGRSCRSTEVRVDRFSMPQMY